ncbi:MAG: hypothetical protein KGJ36_00095 [Acidobacteriota bacterium]|nr:hypothetical protein [Acidobacteriota bacterium]
MDVSKLDRTDRTVAIASLVTLIAVFLPWWGGSGFGYSTSVSGFGSGYGWLGAILIIAAGVYLVMLRSGSQMPKTSFGPGVSVLGLSAIGAALVILRWATLPRATYPGGFYTVGPRIGIYLTLLAGIIQVVSSFRLFKRSGEAPPWAK